MAIKKCTEFRFIPNFWCRLLNMLFNIMLKYLHNGLKIDKSIYPYNNIYLSYYLPTSISGFIHLSIYILMYISVYLSVENLHNGLNIENLKYLNESYSIQLVLKLIYLTIYPYPSI